MSKIEDAIKQSGWHANGPDEFKLELDDPCEYDDGEAGSFSGRIFKNEENTWDIEFEHDQRSSPMDIDIYDHPTADSAMKAVKVWLLRWEQAAEENIWSERRRQRQEALVG